MRNDIIKIVRGNFFRIAQPLSKITWETSTKTVEDYIPQEGDKLEVNLISRIRPPYSILNVAIDGNLLTYECNGNLECGIYSVEIKIKQIDGQRYRSFQADRIAIVFTNEEAGINVTDELDVTTYNIDPALLLYVKGEKGDPGQDGTMRFEDLTPAQKASLKGDQGEQGIGIQSIEQTTTSDESEGTNVVTITMNDDNHTEYTFDVKNGAQGTKGDDGKSAYDMAVEEGYEGDEVSWLASLKGENGEIGPSGQKGDTGPQGVKGDTVILGNEQEYTLYNVTGNNTNGAMTQDAVSKKFAQIEEGYVTEVDDVSIEGAGSGSNSRSAHGTHLYHAGDKITVVVDNFKGATSSSSTNTLKISITATDSDNVALETILSVSGTGETGYTVEYTLTQDGYLYIFSRCESGRTFTTAVEMVVPYTSLLSQNDVIDNLESDSAVDALSAKQGKVLKSSVDGLTADMDALEDVKDFFSEEESIIDIVNGTYNSSTAYKIYSTKKVLAGKKYRFNVSLEGTSRAGQTTGSILFFKITEDRNDGNVLEEIKTYPAGVALGHEFEPIHETFDYVPAHEGYLYVYINVKNIDVSGKTYDPANISAVRIFSTEDILDEEIKDVVGDMPIGELLDLTDLVTMNNLDLQVEDKYNGTLTYRGLKVNFKDYVEPTYHFDVDKIDITGSTTLGAIASGKSAQGFCCYDGIAFNFYDDGYYDAIDVENHTILYSSALPDGAQKAKNHAGNAVFGIDKFDSNDRFPALYISSYEEDKTYVFRVKNDYTMELRQNIYLTNGTLNNGNYVLSENDAFFVDRDRCVIKIGSGSNDDKRKKWMIFDLPVLPTSSTIQDVYLLEKYKIDEFYFRSVRGKDTQDGFVFDAGFAKNGKLYLCTAKKFSDGNLVVFDYYNKRVVNDIPLSAFGNISGITAGNIEPEECYPLDDNTLLFNCNSTGGSPQNYLLKMIFGDSSNS